jgi:hypothetical protein
MKKITAIVVFLVTFVTVSFGQYEFATKDSTLKGGAYIGVLGSADFHSLKVTETPMNGRIGGNLSYDLFPFVQFKTFGIFDASYGKTETNQDTIRHLALSQFSIRLHTKSDNLFFEFGKIPGPTTEIRPLPPSGDGQFETWNHAHGSGLGVGGKVGYTFKKFTLTTGVIMVGDNPEYHLKGRFVKNEKEWTSVGLYAQNDSTFGGMIENKYGRVFNLTVFTNEVVGDFLNVTISEKKKIDGFCDFGYNYKLKKIVRCEIGALKNFSVPYIGGLIAVSYRYETRSINGYMYIYLSRR